MKRTLIKELKGKAGQVVKLNCWLQTVRDQGRIRFAILRDVSGLVQGVVTKSAGDVFEELGSLSVESVLMIEGLVKEEKQAPGGFEVAIQKVEVLSQAASPLPIPVIEKGSQEVSQPKRLDWRWLDLRKPEKRLIFEIWTTMELAFREHLISRGFVEIHSPKIMGAPSESGAELFEVKYFDRKAYLAQSPQFYKQMAMAAGFERVMEIGPVFRANPSFTTRHDTEFTMWDLEMSFIDSHHDVMKEEEEMLVAVFQAVKEKHGDKIKEFFGREVVVPKTPFPKLTLAEVKQILAGKKISNEKEGDLSPEEERELGRYIEEKENHQFVFIIDYPTKTRPFYHMRFERNPKLTKGFDLLFKGLEITTGAQREHRYEVLVKQAKEKGLNLELIKFYLSFFKYGCPPHGGCAPGPSRILMQLLGTPNVREVTYLYRGVKRITP